MAKNTPRSQKQQSHSKPSLFDLLNEAVKTVNSKNKPEDQLNRPEKPDGMK